VAAGSRRFHYRSSIAAETIAAEFDRPPLS
jgi:hypothetical protein